MTGVNTTMCFKYGDVVANLKRVEIYWRSLNTLVFKTFNVF